MPIAITVARIGVISRESGTDEYVLLSGGEDGLTPKQAIEWLLPQVYRETHQEAGGYFCRTVRAVQAQDSDNVVICTIEHRYDV